MVISISSAVICRAIWHTGGNGALVRDAYLQSPPTHAHPRSQLACAFYCVVARAYLYKLDDPWRSAEQALDVLYQAWPDQTARDAFINEPDVLRNFPKSNQLRGTGYVPDTIWPVASSSRFKAVNDIQGHPAGDEFILIRENVPGCLLPSPECQITGGLGADSAIAPHQGWKLPYWLPF